MTEQRHILTKNFAGERFASKFGSKQEAKAWAKDFCERNGITFVWAK